ncbi:photosystem II reaction center protein Psb28 [Synechococcus sp. PCC 7336]|uniref:photosystem II reaction center protein Psb28 n=1 Tax=Synechococcus sp. PCC 7336 TaxID=195250 RepID=UPI000372E649|nr:photosystem II reaction center protein Psb28 [Synechococcus sp. PCC 7336]
MLSPRSLGDRLPTKQRAVGSVAYDRKANLYKSLFQMARIELTPGISEVPSNVRVMRSKAGDRASAIFTFADPSTQDFEVPGMTLSDEEGKMVTRDVRVKFTDGKFKALEAIYSMTGDDEWERFLRFMERFAEANEMGLGE